MTPTSERATAHDRGEPVNLTVVEKENRDPTQQMPGDLTKNPTESLTVFRSFTAQWTVSYLVS